MSMRSLHFIVIPTLTHLTDKLAMKSKDKIIFFSHGFKVTEYSELSFKALAAPLISSLSINRHLYSISFGFIGQWSHPGLYKIEWINSYSAKSTELHNEYCLLKQTCNSDLDFDVQGLLSLLMKSPFL